MEYADLAIIDLAKMHTAEGRAELAKQAKDAMREEGFFYVINHGYSPEKVLTACRTDWNSKSDPVDRPSAFLI